MRAVKKIALLTVLSVLVLSAMFFPSMCQAATVGVQVGDWFKYEGTVVLWEADEGVPFPPHEWAYHLYQYNESDWIRYTVTDIDGADVTFEVVTHWSNGTETTETVVENIENSIEMLVIGANLEAGDQVRPEQDLTEIMGFPLVYPPRTLNDTIELEYLTGNRTANVLDWELPAFFNAWVRWIHNWDKETGIFVLFEVHNNDTIFGTDDQYAYISRLKLIDSSIEELVIPEVFTTVVLLLTLSASTISIVLYKRRKLHLNHYPL